MRVKPYIVKYNSNLEFRCSKCNCNVIFEQDHCERCNILFDWSDMSEKIEDHKKRNIYTIQVHED